MFTLETLRVRIAEARAEDAADEALERLAQELEPHASTLWRDLGPTILLMIEAETGGAGGQSVGDHHVRFAADAPGPATHCDVTSILPLSPAGGSKNGNGEGKGEAAIIAKAPTRDLPSRPSPATKARPGAPWYMRINWDRKIDLHEGNAPVRLGDITRADLLFAAQRLNEAAHRAMDRATACHKLANFLLNGETLYAATERLGDRFPHAHIQALAGVPLDEGAQPKRSRERVRPR